jgi:hypothetical protein
MGRHRYVLLLAPGIGTPVINEFGFVVFEHFHYIGSACHLVLLNVKLLVPY